MIWPIFLVSCVVSGGASVSGAVAPGVTPLFMACLLLVRGVAAVLGVTDSGFVTPVFGVVASGMVVLLLLARLFLRLLSG